MRQCLSCGGGLILRRLGGAKAILADFWAEMEASWKRNVVPLREAIYEQAAVAETTAPNHPRWQPSPNQSTISIRRWSTSFNIEPRARSLVRL